MADETTRVFVDFLDTWHIEATGSAGGKGYCVTCGPDGSRDWPCPVRRTLDALAAAQRENEKLREDSARMDHLRRVFARNGRRLIDPDTVWRSSVCVSGAVSSVELCAYSGSRDGLFGERFNAIIDAALRGEGGA